MGKSSKLINRSKSLSTPIKEQAGILPHAAQLGEHAGEQRGEGQQRQGLFPVTWGLPLPSSACKLKFRP